MAAVAAENEKIAEQALAIGRRALELAEHLGGGLLHLARTTWSTINHLAELALHYTTIAAKVIWALVKLNVEGLWDWLKNTATAAWDWIKANAGTLLQLILDDLQISLGTTLMVLGIALAILGAGGEIFGFALDVFVVTAPGGLALNAVGGLAIVGGLGLTLYGSHMTAGAGRNAYDHARQLRSPSKQPETGELRYKLKDDDEDWRGQGKTTREAIDHGFEKTGVDRDEFTVTRWGVDKNGKSFPVEWRVESGPNKGAEVNVDNSHLHNGPDAPHVGWQTAGKRGSGGAKRGHILLDDVEYHR